MVTDGRKKKSTKKKTIIPDFYESRWNTKGVMKLLCKESNKKNVDYLNYLRKEYELWALWIDKFYNGKHGIFKIGGDAPRYALEDRMEFCDWKKTYETNYQKRNHLANHTVRSNDIINILRKLFEEAYNYVPVNEEDSRDFLTLEEIQKNMMDDTTYKQKWFQAAFDANHYIFRQLMKEKSKTKKSKKASKY